MAKFDFAGLPPLTILKPDQIEQVHANALKILEDVGVYFDSDEAVGILADAGCTVDRDAKIVKFPSSLVLKCIELAPETIRLYDRDGELYTELGGNKVHFDPCSCPSNVLLDDGVSIRQSSVEDLKTIIKVADTLDQYDLQSGAVVCHDVPVAMDTIYANYLIMKGSKKPIIDGAIDVPGVRRTFELFKAIRGSEQAVREKPYAIFDICPAPPLKWSEISSANIIDCARLGLPIETISLPLPGAGSPVTLAGSIVQHTAETLSGLVLAQVIHPGLPFSYGGAPVLFDMRTTTTPMAALEANMISCGYALMGKYYGLPTHTYATLSDAKVVDYQAGYETAMSGLLCALSGFNMISGAGGLDYVAEFSIEKLVMDAEVIGMIKRLLRGIEFNEETLAQALIYEIGPGGDFLKSKHTRKWFKREQYMPSPVVDRQDRANWDAAGQVGIYQRAKEQLAAIRQQPGRPLDTDRSRALDQALMDVAAEAGVTVPLTD
jgi:trimethylamine--corrinoid protein Co-methyltransferase